MSIKKIYLLIATTLFTWLFLLASPVLPTAIAFSITLQLILLTPGLLVWTRFYQHKHTGTAKLLVFSAALGIILLFIEGLILNTFLPLLHIREPLQIRYLVPTYILSCLCLFIPYLSKAGKVIANSRVEIQLQASHNWKLSLPLILPLAAVAGAFRLNNGADASWTIVLLTLIGLATIICLWRPHFFFIEWFIFNSALALLLSTSMRSWYLTGFDISQEFQVFSLTLQHHFWDLKALPGDAYNACLSITILPAVLQQMTGVAAEYIFKFNFQIIFALTAVVVYLTARQYTSTRLSLLASVFYMAQAQFIEAMYAIGRQEISMLFFGLLILLLSNKQHLSRNHKVLVVLVSLGMVLSHYSTSYVAIVIIAIATLVSFCRYMLVKWHTNQEQPSLALSPSVGLQTVAYLLLITTIWYSQINLVSNNLGAVIKTSLTNLSSTFNSASHSLQGIPTLLGATPSKPLNLTAYKQENNIHLSLLPVAQPLLQVHSASIAAAANDARIIAILLVEVILPLSPFILLFLPHHRERMQGIVPFAIGSVAIIGLLILLPNISYDYNLERAYVQGLFVLGVPTMLILYEYFPIKKRAIKYSFVAGHILLYFVTSPGSELINQLAGGIDPPLNMNNTGTAYQEYYTLPGEVGAARWFGIHCTGSSAYADRYASLRLTAYGGIPFDSINPDILKTSANSCLLLDNTNIAHNTYYGYLHRQTVPFMPTRDPFYETNNLVYTNGQSEVYSR